MGDAAGCVGGSIVGVWVAAMRCGDATTDVSVAVGAGSVGVFLTATVVVLPAEATGLTIAVVPLLAVGRGCSFNVPVPSPTVGAGSLVLPAAVVPDGNAVSPGTRLAPGG